MSTQSRIVLGIAALALGLMYVFPIWTITLDAPQYPEGIGMNIWIDTVTGVKEHDLANINGLNHYIGMKTIEPDTIAELKMMPWIIGLIMLLGLITAAIGKRWMLYAWVGMFIVISFAGLVDFYLWEYDYGHNLDPTAAISIPGMSYQPPLIGSKKLLNFTANSWPAAGGWAAFLSMMTGLLLVVFEWRNRKQSHQAKTTTAARRSAASRHQAALATVVLLLGFAACTPEPQPIAHGHDQCTYCKMGLVDNRYGAELVTKTGKVYKFDSIECLASHQLEGQVAPEDVHSLWFVDFKNPPNLVAADEVFFLHSRDLRSPMGMNLTAFGPGIEQQAVLHSFYGTLLDWPGVLDLVRDNGQPAADSMHPAEHAVPPQP